MFSTYEIVQQIINCTSLNSDSIQLLNKFAESLGWKPSDYLEVPEISEFSALHLVVEHGLENTAVVSFLRPNYPSYGRLSYQQRIKLLSLSYNNLVDWHFPIGEREATIVNNRLEIVNDREIIQIYPISSMNFDFLRSEVFEQAIGKRVNPNLPALDDALIRTISDWKRRLSAELNYNISIAELSALFNSVILARAIEDDYRRFNRVESKIQITQDSQLLIQYLRNSSNNFSLGRIIRQVITDLIGSDDIPEYLIDDEKLKAFDDLSKTSVSSLFSDFYRWTGIPYNYDFSVMSKHALSRIYEHYVSILKVVESPKSNQPDLPGLENNPFPVEEKPKALGSVYTPQFIARFFAKFFNKESHNFMTATVTDPACGSGIFLRTFLELRFEEIITNAKENESDLPIEEIDLIFKTVQGYDYDANAINATKLSLALLYLVVVGKFPSKIEAFHEEVIEAFQREKITKESRQVILANPPFVSRDVQYPVIRERIDSLMAKNAIGRVDMYQAFLFIALEMLKPGGFGMFVLPFSFLLTETAKGLRKLLHEKTWILCLVDLSEIRVFGDKGVYSILLIFQKKVSNEHSVENVENIAPNAVIAKSRDLVGKTLQAVLDRRYQENQAFSVYEVNQETFASSSWIVLPPSQAKLKSHYESLPKLGDFMEINQGFVSGHDKVFIVTQEQYNKFPKKEREIFIPYLKDREMQAYDINTTQNKSFFFYPYIGGQIIDENDLRKTFPKIYEYLSKHRTQLESRSGITHWWKPTRLRQPQNMMRPKILTPHLVIMPRFSLDEEGKYAVSRSPFLYPKIDYIDGETIDKSDTENEPNIDKSGIENDLLKYFLAVLNSQACYWFITSKSNKFGNNYSVIEVSTLKEIAVPNPSNVSNADMRTIISTVNKRLNSEGRFAISIEREIDELVANLYGLSQEERKLIGMI